MAIVNMILGGGKQYEHIGLLDSVLTSIPDSFRENVSSYVKTLSFPECSYIGSSAFASFRTLETIYFPKCETIGTNAFESASALYVSFDKCETIHGTAFQFASFNDIYFPSATVIGISAFKNLHGYLHLQSYSNYLSLYSIFGLSRTSSYVSSTTGDTIYRHCVANLTGVEFGNDLSTIPSYTFWCAYSLSECIAPGCTSIGYMAFNNASSLTRIYAPNVTSIIDSAFQSTTISEAVFPYLAIAEDNAFHGCNNLEYVSLSTCSAIYSWAFANISSGSGEFHFPAATTIMGSAFTNCKRYIYLDAYSSALRRSMFTTSFTQSSSYIQITGLNVPNVTDIESSCYRYASLLSEFIAPKLTGVAGSAFEACSALVKAYIPSCKSINYMGFSGCYVLSDLYCPNVEIVYSRAFGYCSALSTLSLPKCSKIYGDYTFMRCQTLSSLYLLSNDVVTLDKSYAFDYTPIASGTGNIYVPSSLVTGYKYATNWTYYSAAITAYTE